MMELIIHMFIIVNFQSHDLGWELSPIDLVMSNSILKPVFSPEQLEVQTHSLLQ